MVLDWANFANTWGCSSSHKWLHTSMGVVSYPNKTGSCFMMMMMMIGSPIPFLSPVDKEPLLSHRGTVQEFRAFDHPLGPCKAWIHGGRAEP